MIYKNIENFTQELSLFPIQGRNIELSFSGDRKSRDGGLLLIRELESQLNLLSSASNCIHDDIYHRYNDHSIKKNNNTFYSYKNHVKANTKTKIIEESIVTDELVHDSQAMEPLLS